VGGVGLWLSVGMGACAYKTVWDSLEGRRSLCFRGPLSIVCISLICVSSVIVVVYYIVFLFL
jgi:hypothetical protein